MGGPREAWAHPEHALLHCAQMRAEVVNDLDPPRPVLDHTRLARLLQQPDGLNRRPSVDQASVGRRRVRSVKRLGRAQLRAQSAGAALGSGGLPRLHRPAAHSVPERVACGAVALAAEGAQARSEDLSSDEGAKGLRGALSFGGGGQGLSRDFSLGGGVDA
jgi:hypothetical protein